MNVTTPKENFLRWECLDSNTAALRIFNKHHSEINNYIWSFVPLQCYGEYLVRNDKSINDIHGIFHVSGPDARRVEKEKPLWTKNFKDFQNWTYIHALNTVLSYMEIYVKRITTTALLSDPGSTIGASRSVDGTVLLKENRTIDTNKIVLSFIKGTWPERSASLEKVFSKIPDSLKNNVGQLDKLRKIRNRAAHGFSRKEGDIFRDKLNDNFHDKISLSQLKDYMKLIHQVVIDIDNQLLKNNIGEFESIRLYHEHHESFKGFRNEKARSFRRILNDNNVGNPRGKGYCESLVNYYYDI